ncbi:hypothetical protein Hanom_Chr09g00783331 [Helianthus anomalus]
MSKVESQQTWKPVTPRFRTQQSWKTTVDATKPNQFWKPKVVVQNQNSQNESRFYNSNVSKGQIWAVKQQKVSVEEKLKENVFEKNYRNYPVLSGKIYVQLPESKQAWVDLLK